MRVTSTISEHRLRHRASTIKIRSRTRKNSPSSSYVQNRIIYYLTVEAVEKCENDEKSCNVICLLKMERHPWRLTKPQLTYQNCTNDSITSTTSSHENDNDSNVSSNNVINPPEIIENSSGDIENGTTTTVNYDEVISSLNEEIIEVNNYNVSNKETYAVEASVRNNEGHEPETTTKVLTFEVVSLNFDETTIGTTDLSYETSTLSYELSSTEQTTVEELSVTEATVIPDLTTSNADLSN